MTAPSDRLDRRPPPAIPIVVLTGFLGAGKTTILNRWVKTPALADAAVIINEFGAIGLDHLLVEKAEGTVLTLSSGCLCCTIRGDLIDTLEDLIRRRDNGRVTPFGRLVIETTGLADPAPVLNTLMFHPYLPLRYRIDCVVTVIDAVHGAATIEKHEEAFRQAAVADTLLLSKTDLAAERSDAALRALLKQINPGARMLEASAEPEAVVQGGLFSLDTRSDDVRTWLDPDRYAHEHDGHDHRHHHDVNRHDKRIAAACLTADEPLPDAAFAMFLDLLRGTYGKQLLRAKGVVALRSDPDRPLVVHGVQHYFHPAHKLAAWPDPDHRSRFVVIARDLDPAIVQKLWDGFFAAPAIDRPDAAALIDSELSSRPAGLLG